MPTPSAVAAASASRSGELAELGRRLVTALPTRCTMWPSTARYLRTSGLKKYMSVALKSVMKVNTTEIQPPILPADATGLHGRARASVELSGEIHTGGRRCKDNSEQAGTAPRVTTHANEQAGDATRVRYSWA